MFVYAEVQIMQVHVLEDLGDNNLRIPTAGHEVLDSNPAGSGNYTSGTDFHCTEPFVIILQSS